MSSLIFQRLVLISDSKEQANQFIFQKRLNLITGKDNSIGKSTLAKSLLWSLGCDLLFDEEWKSNDIKSILYFTIDEKEYFSCRGKNTIILGTVEGDVEKFTKITGAFSKKISALCNFEIRLPNRDSGALESPPPAYYLLPFYIDQVKSWNSPWNSFENLTQYSDWKNSLIKYFTGYLKAEYFDIEEDIYDYREFKLASLKMIEKFDSAVEVIADQLDDYPIALDKEAFYKIQEEIKVELNELMNSQSLLYNQQTILNTNIYDLEKQYELITNSVNNLEEDYKFAVEYIPTDNLECPLCGTIHDNSLVQRAGLLSEKDSLLEHASIIQDKIKNLKLELAEINGNVKFITDKIEKINIKYINDYGHSENDEYAKVINLLSSKNISSSIQNKIQNENTKINNTDKSISELKKDQRKLITKNQKKELSDYFMSLLTENIEMLGSTGIKLDNVKSPTDYKKLLGGGAAEGTRGLFAYQLSILQQIHQMKTCVIAPFIIDTPNQQEQAHHRYETIIDVLMSSVPQDYQIILCAMENKALDKFKQEANVIELDESKILTTSQYQSLRKEYSNIQKMAINKKT